MLSRINLIKMNNLTLKTLFRGLLRRRFLTLIQIGGLIIGFTIVIFLLAKIEHERSYDSFWKNHQSIYRLGLDLSYPDGRAVQSAKNFHGSSELLRAEVPGIAAHCNLAPDMITVYFQEKKIQDVDWFWSDTTFFSVFDRKLIYKETDPVLGDLHGIVVSESFAHKLFGNENPLNKEISLNEGWKFLIKGVFEDIPANSHLKIDVLGSYQSLSYYMKNYDVKNQVLVENPDFVHQKPSPYTKNRWTSSIQYRPYCYIRLDDKTSISDVASALLPAIQKVGLPPALETGKINFFFQPVSSIHLYSSLDNELGQKGSAMQVNFLIIIGLVVLVVCIVNFINLSTIATFDDRKSNAIKLLNGSRKLNILGALTLQNSLICFLSLLFAIPLAVFVIRAQIPGGAISNLVLLIIALIAGISAFLASFIPYLSVFRTPYFLTLKGQSTSGTNQNWSGRKALVVMQFTITIVLIISTVGIYKQMNFVMKENLGFTGSQSVFCFTPMSMTNHPDIPVKLRTFRDEVLALPGVNSFSVGSSVPGREIFRSQENIMPSGSSEPFASPFSQISIDEEFLDTYHIQLIAGQNLEERSNWTSDEVLINRSAAEVMGHRDPLASIGSSFQIATKAYKVRGVIENYHHVSLHYQIKPAIYFQDLIWDKSVGYYSFNLKSPNITEVMADVEKIWKKLYPKDDFIYFFSDKEFEVQYRNDVNFNQILTYSAILALIISLMGLLSLAIFNTKQRIKEIGIRKVNGATIKEVMTLLNRDFVKWVAIAFVVAMPIAWYAMHKWLENFAYKTTLSWWIFALAGLLALGIALLTVSWQSWRAATRNPVEALRYE
jgi:putative ABC transport system permease protein